MRTSGSSPTPLALPCSTSQPDGMSTETMGSLDEERSDNAESNGGRTGGLNEKPKIASRMTSFEDNSD